MNFLVAPIFYQGSCFEDIVFGILDTAKKNNLKFKLMPIEYKKLNSFGLENTNEYFDNSLKKLIFLKNKLKNGDKVLLIDYFFPGADLLEYFLKRNNISVFKVALMHGGSFVDGDLYNGYTWLNNFEKGWFDVFDLIVSPSNFFIKDLDESFKSKVKILPWGLSSALKPNFENKKIDVIFPHRFSYDKGVEDLLLVVEKMPNVNFFISGTNEKIIKNFPEDLKDLYFKLKSFKNVKFLGIEGKNKHINTLRSSKIIFSSAIQEGFGYSVFKAIQCGAVPVLPKRCCYTEFFDEKYLYSSIDEAVQMINNFINIYPKHYFYPDLKIFNFNELVNFFK